MGKTYELIYVKMLKTVSGIYGKFCAVVYSYLALYCFKTSLFVPTCILNLFRSELKVIEFEIPLKPFNFTFLKVSPFQMMIQRLARGANFA